MTVQSYWRWPRGRLGLLAFAAAVAAATLAQPTGARAANKSATLVVDANSGRALYQSAADEPRYPASLTKMMTIYIAFELIEQGRLSYQTKLKMSANAAATSPSKLDLEEGEEIALIDALKALITKSANDIAVAIAEHVSGSEGNFARLMTQKARQIGMTATTFRNASGLPDEEQVTTARDIITLALRLQDDFPQHYQLFATRTFTYKDETFRNHNTLLFNYEGTDGLKTGYTRASGFNVVASVRRGQKHVVGVVFGGATAASRNSAMRTFLNIGLVKASSEKTRRPAPRPLVARAKPAPERRLAAAPTPQRIERPAPPPALAADAPQAQPAGYPIEIARVRPVLVSPRAATGQPTEPAALAQAPLAGDAQPRAWDQAAALVPPGATALLAPAPGRMAAAPPDRPTLLAAPQFVRGATASTLDQQAGNLARGEAPVVVAPPPIAASPTLPTPARLKAPQVVSASAPAAGFQVQIGAYQNLAEAERQLGAVRERAGNLLARSADVTQQVKQGDKVIYRARYAGFDGQAAAANVCSELKRLKIDCLVMKAE